MNNLVIVAGATSDIAKAYIKSFSKDAKIIGISRRKANLNQNNFTSFVCDLLDRHMVFDLFNKINLDAIDKIIFIHTIGDDVFECVNYPQIDMIDTINPLVYATNVNTFKNPLDALINKLNKLNNIGKNIKLNVFFLGAITDKYNIPFFTSFRESKNLLRAHLENLTKRYNWLKGMTINVSTVKTKLSLRYRPYAHTSYWLTPQEVVDKSMDEIINLNESYKEIEIFKFDPNFEKDYYINNDKIYKKWVKEMYNKDWKK